MEMPWRYSVTRSVGERPIYTMKSLHSLYGLIRASCVHDACQMWNEDGVCTALGNAPLIRYLNPDNCMFLRASYLEDELADLAIELS